MCETSFNIATSVMYGMHRDKRVVAELYHETFFENIDFIKKHFKIPEYLVINCRPIPRRTCMLGAAWKDDEICVIDIEVRQSFNKFFATLFHELTHIEQFDEGRLCVEEEGKDIIYIWEGTRYNRLHTLHDDYCNSPWEVEADKKSERIMKKFKRTLI